MNEEIGIVLSKRQLYCILSALETIEESARADENGCVFDEEEVCDELHIELCDLIRMIRRTLRFVEKRSRQA